MIAQLPPMSPSSLHLHPTGVRWRHPFWCANYPTFAFDEPLLLLAFPQFLPNLGSLHQFHPVVDQSRHHVLQSVKAAVVGHLSGQLLLRFLSKPDLPSYQLLS